MDEYKEIRKDVEIYTDGACSGNPGKGGWGAVLLCNGYEKKISGFEYNTTNNKMELTAVLRGLQALKFPCNVKVYSDSAYVVNSVSLGWLDSWTVNGRLARGEVANADLWREYLNLREIHNITFIKVKGHAGNKYNEMCDSLAKRAIKGVIINE